MLVLTYDLSFKVVCDFQGQTYANHALSPLLWHVEVQYVLPSYRKSWSRSPLAILMLTYDLSFKVICDFEGQQIISLSLCSSLYNHTKDVNCNASMCGFNINEIN